MQILRSTLAVCVIRLYLNIYILCVNFGRAHRMYQSQHSGKIVLRICLHAYCKYNKILLLMSLSTYNERFTTIVSNAQYNRAERY